MKYYIAVYEKLREIYHAQSSLKNDVSLICPSLVMYEKEDLQLLNPDLTEKDLSKLGESYRKKADVAYQLNTVPVSDTFWDVNPSNSLSDIYENILNDIKLPGLESSIAEIADKSSESLWDQNGKETKEYKTYLKYLRLYEKKLEEITQHFESYEENFSGEEAKNWQEKLSIKTKEKDLSLMELEVKGYKNKVEKALEYVNKSNDSDLYVASVNNAKAEFTASATTDTIMNTDLHSIGFIPYDFMDSEKGWTSLKLSRTELDGLYNTAKNGSSRLPPAVISIDYEDTTIEGIELDYQFVHLKRRWFHKSLFLSDKFAVKTGNKISDGKTISNDFLLPAFPKVMILIKNLKIMLSKTVTEQQVLTPNILLNFGPLFLKQQMFINKATNEKFLKAVTNKETIKSDQLNYMKRKTAIDAIASKPLVVNEEIKPITELKESAPGTIRAAENVKVYKPVNISVSEAKNIKNLYPARGLNTPTATVMVNPAVFTAVPLTILPMTSLTTFNFSDKVTGQPLYKCAISIRGIGNNWFFEKETNEIGQFSVNIAPGNYNIEYRLDGYQTDSKSFRIITTNPQVFNYQIEREEIKFSSYFLIGMICEKLPMISNTQQ